MNIRLHVSLNYSYVWMYAQEWDIWQLKSTVLILRFLSVRNLKWAEKDLELPTHCIFKGKAQNLECWLPCFLKMRKVYT